MGDKDLREGRAFRERIAALLGEGNLREALEGTEARLQQLPGDPDARIALCRIRIAQGRLAEAMAMLGDMEEILGRLAEVYACLGDIHRQEDRWEAAEGCYRKFLLLDPGTPLARDLAAQLEVFAAGREAAGNREAPEGDGAIPADFQTLTLAELYLRQGHLAMAEEVLEAILQRDPSQVQAAKRLGEIRERGRRGAVANGPGLLIGELNRWLANVGRLRSHAG